MAARLLTCLAHSVWAIEVWSAPRRSCWAANGPCHAFLPQERLPQEQAEQVPTHGTWGWVQVNSHVCRVAYETGETEELQVDELIRDGIMSLGWRRARPASAATSDHAYSPGSGARPSSVHGRGSPYQLPSLDPHHVTV